MSTFQNRYQNHSNRKLVEIIDSPPGHYQGEALKAARAVLAERQVSEAEIQAIRAEIADEAHAKAQKAAEQVQKREAIANKVHQTLEPVDMVRLILKWPIRSKPNRSFLQDLLAWRLVCWFGRCFELKLRL